MAPNYQKFNKCRNTLLELRRQVFQVHSMDDLLDLQQQYFVWIDEARSVIKGVVPDTEISLLYTDPIMSDIAYNGGAGISFNGEQAQSRFADLRHQIPVYINFMDRISHHFGRSLITQKNNTFFYQGKEIVGLTENPYRFLNGLMALCDENGFVSYDRMIRYFKDNNLELAKDERKTLTNARDNLFVRAKVNGDRLPKLHKNKKIIDTKRGEGFIFNNEVK